jgi:hypothetical protein
VNRQPLHEVLYVQGARLGSIPHPMTLANKPAKVAKSVTETSRITSGSCSCRQARSDSARLSRLSLGTMRSSRKANSRIRSLTARRKIDWTPAGPMT